MSNRAASLLLCAGYGLEIDMWALGVILYILLCGFPPFRSPDRKQSELFRVIKEGYFEFLSPYWDNNSKSEQPRIILPARRCASVILELPWVCVRLSRVGVVSKRMDQSSWFLAWGLLSTYPAL